MGHNTKTKKETIWIFKPGEGLLCEGKPGTYTNATANTDTLSLWPKNNTQGQRYYFNKDFSNYLGKGYNVKISFCLSNINVDYISFIPIVYSPFKACNSNSKRTFYPGLSSDDILTVIIPLDDCIFSTFPCLSIDYYKAGTSINLDIKELCVFREY